VSSLKPAIRPGGPVSTFFIGLLVGLLRWLSPVTRRVLAEGLGDLAYLLGIRRRVAFENLRAAFPELTEPERRQIAHRCYHHLVQTAFDAVTADRVTDLEKAVVVENWGAFGEALQRGGVLLASAHFGSWELFADVMTRRGVKLSAVVRPLEGAFNARVVKARQDAGVQLILQRGALRAMLKAVRAGRCVAQLIDQSLPADAGVFVPFFGRPASTTPALAMAAVVTKAPVFVGVSMRGGDEVRMIMEGPIPVPDTGDRRADVTALTATLTAEVEKLIRRAPEQWLWLHRRWKVQPP